MPSFVTTQRKRSRSGIPKDSVLKFPKVSQSTVEMWLPLNLPAANTVCSHTGETGLLVARIGDRMPFTGYANNKQQTEKKKLYDVLVKGDKYFNSGDLLKIDHEGFIYFQDRIGDTFRYVNSTALVLNGKDSLFVQLRLLHFGCCGN